ncbi:MAG: glycosyltransferase family 9 protein [Candidatus Omnitrophica bacterium]|nr:glycosyltransferase family 9 protein [Candidatus Omnitrophota bacterium]
MITLSNIGDVLLAAPVLDILLRDFPSAQLSLVIGERAASLFEGNARISRIHIFDKQRSAIEQARWTLDLRQYQYDAVIDLRNSMIGYFLTPRWLTPPLLVADKKSHLKDLHLNRLRSLYDFQTGADKPLSILPSSKDSQRVDQCIQSFLGKDSSFVLIAPYAADLSKTWDLEKFVQLSQSISRQYGLKIVMIGSTEHRVGIEEIVRQSRVSILNLAGQTNLIQLMALVQRSKIAIVHDSGPMHMASYLNKPIVALFGPTQPKLSGPWSSLNRVVWQNDQCPRCLNLGLVNVSHNCMSAISEQDVLKAFGEVYAKIS